MNGYDSTSAAYCQFLKGKQQVASRRQFDGFDVLKFVLSIFIVAIHIDPFGGSWLSPYRYPWLRLAVPLFFVVSAYLFFSGFDTLTDPSARAAKIKKYCKRSAQLYGFWLVVLFVPTAILRGDFSKGFPDGLFNILHGLFFGSTFVASWYITASVIAVLLIYVLSKRLSNRAQLAIALVVYAICCCSSNYGDWFLQFHRIEVFAHGFDRVLGSPYNNFMAGYSWMVIGKVIADRDLQRKHAVPNNWHRAVFLVVALAALFGEWVLTKKLDAVHANDCYFTLIPATIAIFAIARDTRLTSKHARNLRMSSTITYCMHGTIGRMIALVYPVTAKLPYAPMRFIFVLCLCWLAAFVISKLMTKDKLKWLKYAC